MHLSRYYLIWHYLNNYSHYFYLILQALPFLLVLLSLLVFGPLASPFFHTLSAFLLQSCFHFLAFQSLCFSSFLLRIFKLLPLSFSSLLLHVSVYTPFFHLQTVLGKTFFPIVAFHIQVLFCVTSPEHSTMVQHSFL